MINMNY